MTFLDSKLRVDYTAIEQTVDSDQRPSDEAKIRKGHSTEFIMDGLLTDMEATI